MLQSLQHKFTVALHAELAYWEHPLRASGSAIYHTNLRIFRLNFIGAVRFRQGG